MKNWSDLFRPARKGIAPRRTFTVLRKGGHPILYLPDNRQMADVTLRLYPAQTLFARTLIHLLRAFSPLGIWISARKVEMPINENNGFAQFLKSLIPGSTQVPDFGVLCGNIKAVGRRYVLLLFDASGNPAVVVKLGASKEGCQLICVEQEFFFPKSPDFPGLPEALSYFNGEGASAIAYRYVEGSSPLPQQFEKVAELLSSWVYDVDPLPMKALPVWQSLELIAQESPDLEPVIAALRTTAIKPVLFHGDFAPWNIRVCSAGHWVVLDWERSARTGPPGWDWFHYVFQYQNMVRRTSAQETLSVIERLWQAPDFLSYAKKTGIEKVLKELTFFYLLHLLRFHAPRDKADGIRHFLKAFRAKFFPRITLNSSRLSVSVVTPSYKQLPWLRLCAASVADQDGVVVEHIIQDAQSGADVEEWVQTHTKAQLYVECDTGMYDAINRGFARASGEIVSWLNSDEQYLDGTLAKVTRFFETHPEIDVLFGDALLIGNKGNLLSYRRTVAPTEAHIHASHLNVLSCATFVRRSVLDRGYNLDTRWKAIADAVWIADLLHAGIPIAVLHEPLAVFTITDKNLGQTSLAAAELRQWQRETSAKSAWLRPYVVAWHRWSKLVSGAYWPRSASVRIYTLESPSERVVKTADRISFRWPAGG
jgi:glycosyltransferase involved in cell wall biosynthesis